MEEDLLFHISFHCFFRERERGGGDKCYKAEPGGLGWLESPRTQIEAEANGRIDGASRNRRHGRAARRTARRAARGRPDRRGRPVLLRRTGRAADGPAAGFEGVRRRQDLRRRADSGGPSCSRSGRLWRTECAAAGRAERSPMRSRLRVAPGWSHRAAATRRRRLDLGLWKREGGGKPELYTMLG
jgi:hypothetical protein